MTETPDLRIGCSGWQYRHWRRAFYPAELPLSRWFEFYSRQFDTVEINNSFYRLPEAATFARWKTQAPPHFLYAVKASRFLTHMKKLKDPADPLDRFFSNARELDCHLGPVLYQLPPRWPLNLERFEQFLVALDDETRTLRRSGFKGLVRHVVEFREPSWYHEEVFALMRRHHVGLCLHDMHGSATDQWSVGLCIYVRFHGHTKYSGRYEDRVLDHWADWLAGRLTDGLDVYAYFNNDAGGHAPRDAIRLRDRLFVRVASRLR